MVSDATTVAVSKNGIIELRGQWRSFFLVFYISASSGVMEADSAIEIFGEFSSGS